MSWRPAERRTSARYVVAGCKIHESSTLTLSAQTRMPSSVVIVNRYLPEAGKSQYPSHRTENVSDPTEGSGDPKPQSKLIVAFGRTSSQCVRSAMSADSPRNQFNGKVARG